MSLKGNGLKHLRLFSMEQVIFHQFGLGECATISRKGGGGNGRKECLTIKLYPPNKEENDTTPSPPHT